jgi:hypothetical protein
MLAKLLKSTVLTLSLTSAISLVDFSTAKSASALSFTGWSTTGTVTISPPETEADLSTAIVGEPVDNADDLRTLLNLTNSELPGDVFEGSAIYQDLSLNSGDTISFDWAFLSYEAPDPNFGNPDFAFVSLTNATTRQLIQLAGVSIASQSNPYSLLVGAGGSYRLGFGVVDVNDGDVASTLSVSNLQITPGSATPVPTPALLPGLIGLGVSAWRKQKQAR